MTTKNSGSLSAGLIIVLAGMIFALDLHFPRGIAEAVLYVPLVLVSLWSPRRRDTLIAAAGASVLTVLGYWLSPGLPSWIGITNRTLSLVTIWMTAMLVFLYKRLAEEREALIGQLQNALDNIKTLRGLLPICTSCKKIRDDHGYWNQLETYIGAHSDAEFTHGLCPECVQKLYPDYFGNKQAEGSGH